MAEQTKKSKYNFGGHELDAKLYLQNIRDNAETFLNSKTDWTPEQKEEWKHAYTNFTNALQEDINNGGGRFSTDEFGTITDTKENSLIQILIITIIIIKVNKLVRKIMIP